MKLNIKKITEVGQMNEGFEKHILQEAIKSIILDGYGIQEIQSRHFMFQFLIDKGIIIEEEIDTPNAPDSVIDSIILPFELDAANIKGTFPKSDLYHTILDHAIQDLKALKGIEKFNIRFVPYPNFAYNIENDSFGGLDVGSHPYQTCRYKLDLKEYMKEGTHFLLPAPGVNIIYIGQNNYGMFYQNEDDNVEVGTIRMTKINYPGPEEF